MGIRFVPHGLPVLLDDTAQRIGARERRLPSGWWMLPAMIVGFIECAVLITWIVA